MAEYDYLIVGAGLYGAVFAHEMARRGRRCLVIDRRGHIAGNAFTRDVSGVCVHQYGAHVFHTSDREVWDYVNRFAAFSGYVHRPLASYRGELYSLPFNMHTFEKMWGVRTPQEAKAVIDGQIAALKIREPKNLEEQALSLVGGDVYRRLIKGYTEKQWGRDCRELPAFIIRRLPCRFTYDDNYFDDAYQGIPVGGYTQMVGRMLEGIEVRLNTDYAALIRENPRIADRVVYTGSIDEFFGYRLGALQYRSVRFETEVLDRADYQGTAVINYTDREVPYTRVIEHKHFGTGPKDRTVISREYAAEWKPGLEPYYPINDEKNGALYRAYRALADTQGRVIFGGRLGQYCYYDMDQVVRAALERSRQEA